MQITHHLVDRGDDLEHLLSGDVAVAVQVVHGEGPLQLLLELAARRYAQRTQKFAEIDAAVAVGIKSSEHMLREFGGVTVRKKISINFLELLDGELAVGAVLEEALVPLLDLSVRELSVRLHTFNIIHFFFIQRKNIEKVLTKK